MEECPVCHFKKVQEKTTRDPKSGEVVETRSECNNCGHVLRKTEYN